MECERVLMSSLWPAGAQDGMGHLEKSPRIESVGLRDNDITSQRQRHEYFEEDLKLMNGLPLFFFTIDSIWLDPRRRRRVERLQVLVHVPAHGDLSVSTPQFYYKRYRSADCNKKLPPYDWWRDKWSRSITPAPVT
jgi:hypothetical protein